MLGRFAFLVLAFTIGPVTIGPVTIGPVRIGPVTIGPVRIGPVTIGPVTAGPVTAGPVTIRPMTKPALAAVTAAVATPTTASNGAAPIVTRVVDGDTLVVRSGGRTQTVRLIGIDAPETNNRNGAAPCFATESAVRVRQLTRAGIARVEDDPSQGPVDRYGRRLAFIWLPDGSLLNEVLVAGGYATEYVTVTPHRYSSRLHAAAERARRAGLGLWAAATCGGDPGGIEAAAAVAREPAGDSAPCQPGELKGNRRSGIVHAPGQDSYAITRADVRCFASLGDAQAAGFRPARR